jgi:hypothetical protein
MFWANEVCKIMGYDPEKYNRHSIRMKGYDYSLPGAYFVTLISFLGSAYLGRSRMGNCYKVILAG